MVKKIAANAPASNYKPFKMSSFESLTSSSLFTSCTTRPSSLHSTCQ